MCLMNDPVCLLCATFAAFFAQGAFRNTTGPLRLSFCAVKPSPSCFAATYKSAEEKKRREAKRRRQSEGAICYAVSAQQLYLYVSDTHMPHTSSEWNITDHHF